MNFTRDMIERLSPEDRLVLSMLFDKAQIPSSLEKVPEWPWTMKGPATEAQALKARKVGLSPRLTADTAKVAVPLQEALTLTEGRG
jgi:hypothetical protein